MDYKQYAPNWLTEIRPSILRRAGGTGGNPAKDARCEWCGIQNYIVGKRDFDGVFVGKTDIEKMEDGAKLSRFGSTTPKLFKIVITIAHLNHTKEDNRPENLAALCQKCHLNYDRHRHIAKRKANLALKKAAKEKAERNANGEQFLYG